MESDAQQVQGVGVVGLGAEDAAVAPDGVGQQSALVFLQAEGKLIVHGDALSILTGGNCLPVRGLPGGMTSPAALFQVNLLDPVTSSYENSTAGLPRFFRNSFTAAEAALGVSMATPEEREPEEARPAADLLPAVYDELRRLAAALTQQLRPG
jgi:hypothetical protein